MPRKRHTPEEIVAKLRQVDVLTSQGKTTAEAIRSIGVAEATYHRWRNEFGGLKLDQVKRLKELDTRNNSPLLSAGMIHWSPSDDVWKGRWRRSPRADRRAC